MINYFNYMLILKVFSPSSVLNSSAKMHTAVCLRQSFNIHNKNDYLIQRQSGENGLMVKLGIILNQSYYMHLLATDVI